MPGSALPPTLEHGELDLEEHLRSVEQLLGQLEESEVLAGHLPAVSPARRQPLQQHAMTSLRDAREREVASKRRLARLQREMTSAKSESALQTVREKKRALAQSLRTEMDGLTKALHGVEPAGADECRAVAARMHKRMCELSPDPSARGWFRLFKRMDDDGSGRVSYAELEELVRHELQLPPSQLPEPALKAVWVALDADVSRPGGLEPSESPRRAPADLVPISCGSGASDGLAELPRSSRVSAHALGHPRPSVAQGSGYITVKEFGQFMRRGEAAWGTAAE